jgi:hypothetical protein
VASETTSQFTFSTSSFVADYLKAVKEFEQKYSNVFVQVQSTEGSVVSTRKYYIKDGSFQWSIFYLHDSPIKPNTVKIGSFSPDLAFSLTAADLNSRYVIRGKGGETTSRLKRQKPLELWRALPMCYLYDLPVSELLDPIEASLRRVNESISPDVKDTTIEAEFFKPYSGGSPALAGKGCTITLCLLPKRGWVPLWYELRFDTLPASDGKSQDIVDRVELRYDHTDNVFPDFPSKMTHRMINTVSDGQIIDISESVLFEATSTGDVEKSQFLLSHFKLPDLADAPRRSGSYARWFIGANLLLGAGFVGWFVIRRITGTPGSR